MERYFGPLVFTSIVVYSCFNAKRTLKIIASISNDDLRKPPPGYCCNCSCKQCSSIDLSKSTALIKPTECHNNTTDDHIKYGNILGSKRQISVSSKSSSNAITENPMSPLYRKHPRVSENNNNNNNIDNHESDIDDNGKAKNEAFEISVNLKSMEASILKSDYKLVLIRGIPQNPTFDIQKFESLLDTFETRNNDVFVATYVKAGTTWTQQIIHSLLREGFTSTSTASSSEGNITNIRYGESYGESVPWLEACASEMLQPREMPTWSLDKVNQVDINQPRYFKTHATVDHLPGGKYNKGLNSGKKFKIIYVARNPKDTLVSLYFHAKSKPEFGYTGDMKMFLEIFLSGCAENGCWFKHVIDWFQQCQMFPETHLFLKYEDMCDDLPSAVRRIAAFLQLPFPLTDEIINKVVKQSSLNEMRESAGSNIGLNHLRQGGYGGWRKHFTVQMNELFDRVYHVKMKEIPTSTATTTTTSSVITSATTATATVNSETIQKYPSPDLKFNFGPNAHGVDIIM